MGKFVFFHIGKRYVEFVYLYLACFILPNAIHIEETGIFHMNCGNWMQVLDCFFYNNQVHEWNLRFK